MKRALGALALAPLVLAAQGCGNTAPSSVRDDIRTQRAQIVGGVADLNHRYVVSLNGCSGTLISKHTVLSAGHCYDSISSVGFGPKAVGATTISVANKVRDPDYAEICDQDATYDLTVVKLAEAATVQPAPLLRATLDNTPKYIGPSWVWVGYGLTAQGGTSGTKRVTTFPVDLIGPATGRGSLCEIPETLIYATANGRNACNGDSGGPSFFVYGGVEYLAGVVSSGDDACVLDDSQQRSDQPYIDHFIQAQIDANEGDDPCRSNGACDESCNTDGQVGDPDCAAAHCAADAICSEACVAPRDPDCAALDEDNCEDNGVCDLACASDPDCTRDCAAEGNCIPNCPTPDPDCAGSGGAGGTAGAGGAAGTGAGGAGGAGAGGAGGASGNAGIGGSGATAGGGAAGSAGNAGGVGGGIAGAGGSAGAAGVGGAAAGGSASGGAASGGNSGTNGGENSTPGTGESSGCSCRVSAPRVSALWSVGAWLMGLTWLRRRRSAR